MPKDNLKTILKIMEFIQYKRHCQEYEVINKFSTEDWKLFSKYALNSDSSTKDEAYARINPNIELTQLGSRKVFELRRILAEEKRANWIKWATITLAVFAVLGFIKGFL
ncbi:MAG: hypothetical protein ABIJ18_02790 [archaeon]